MTDGPDAEAVGEAFVRYRSHVYRYLLRRTRDHHDADELTQRVFVDASEAMARRGVNPDSMLAWLLTVAERRFIDEVRRRTNARRGIRELQVVRSSGDADYGRELRTALKRAIAELPQEQRQVAIMKLIQGKPFILISEELGVSVDACKMRLSRAVARLRVALEEEGFRPNA